MNHVTDTGSRPKSRTPPASAGSADAAAERPRTVAFVQTQAENAGAQEIARQLAEGAAQAGWRTRQIFFFRRTDSFDHDPNVVFCASERPNSPIAALKFLYRLFCELRRPRPDAVVCFQHYGNVLAGPLARLAGAPRVIANQNTPASMLPKFAALADRWLGRLGVYDRIVVNSDMTSDYFGAYPTAYARRIVRIDHGVTDRSSTLDKAQARRDLGLPIDAPLLGCAARLHPLKQLDLAIQTLAINAGHHLAIAGQGEDLARLQDGARRRGVAERVHFLGELDAQKMRALLAAIDVFVFPSAVETFGLAPAEAALAGVPVIANDIPTLRKVLAADGEACALFVDARNADAYAAEIRRLLASPELAAKLSCAGRRLKSRFPLDKMVKEYLELLQPKDD